MPDIVDRVFEYTSKAVDGTSVILQSAYSVSKDAALYSYDVSKSVGGMVWVNAVDVATKVQETAPSQVDWIMGKSSTSNHLEDLSMSKILGLASSKITYTVGKNIKPIGIGMSLPLLGFTSYKMYRYYVPYLRCAKRLQQNKRFEVVLVLGSMNSTFVCKLVDDLNRRGYVVFVTVSDETELKQVEELNDSDIRPLFIDYSNETNVKNSLLKLGQFLDTRIDKVENEYYYNFKGALVIPDYVKLPKMKKLEELSTSEYQRISEQFFLKFNSLLSNGLLTFIRESNRRRKVVEQYNELKIEGGYSKLLFINFLVVPNNDTRRLIHNLSLDMNHVFFNKLYEENSLSLKDAMTRLFSSSPAEFNKIDMAILDIKLHKNHNSTIIPNSPLLEHFVPMLSKTLSPKDIHHKVFDLLNKSWLSKEHRMEN